MLKTNKKYKTKKNPSVFNIKSDLKKLGVTLVTDDEAYELYLDENPNIYAILGRDVSNLDDVLEQGIKMSKIKTAKNPRKCRTFQAKRKVGKRVIKVTRKICRNPSDLNKKYNKEIDLYLQNSPYFQFLYNKYADEIDVTSARKYALNHGINLNDLELERDSHGHLSTLEFVKALGY